MTKNTHPDKRAVRKREGKTNPYSGIDVVMWMLVLVVGVALACVGLANLKDDPLVLLFPLGAGVAGVALIQGRKLLKAKADWDNRNRQEKTSTKTHKSFRKWKFAGWLFCLALGVSMLAIPFFVAPYLLNWFWSIGALLAFLAALGLGKLVADDYYPGGEEKTTSFDVRRYTQDVISQWLSGSGKARVFRNVRTGGKTLGYVILSPAGLFPVLPVINYGRVTKKGSSIFLNGKPFVAPMVENFLATARRYEADLSKAGHQAGVVPIIAFTRAGCEIYAEKDMVILPVRWLESFIRNRPDQLDQEQLAALAEVIGPNADPELQANGDNQ